MRIRPTTWSCRSCEPSVACQSITVPLVGALTEIRSPSICALSVLT
jgi:hypothetical protein